MVWRKRCGRYAALLVLSVFSLITQTANVLTIYSPAVVVKAQASEQSLAVLGIVFQSMVLMMLILLSIHRWTMPKGTFTLLMIANAIALSFMHYTFLVIPIAAIAGVLIDVVYLVLMPTSKHINEFRLFAGMVPLLLYGVYFMLLWMTEGIVWSVHLSIGSIIVSGIAGWLVRYIAIPPKIPTLASK